MKNTVKELSVIDDKAKSFLFKFNLIAGILHFIQGIVMVVLSNDTLQKITISLPNPNLATRSLTVGSESFFEVRLGPVVASFLFLSAIAHFLLITPKIREWYLAGLSKNRNYARWYEYALSSSVMICLVAILSGIVDFNILFLIFITNACMNLFGLSMEQYNSLSQLTDPEAKVDWTNYIFGVISGLAPWVVVATYFFTAIDRVDGKEFNGRVIEIPEFVKWIFWTLIITFNTFAINMFLQYKKIGPWKNYIFGEKVYIILSLVAKTILAWQVFGGTLRDM